MSQVPLNRTKSTCGQQVWQLKCMFSRRHQSRDLGSLKAMSRIRGRSALVARMSFGVPGRLSKQCRPRKADRRQKASCSANSTDGKEQFEKRRLTVAKMCGEKVCWFPAL
ncbi:hypothetical protein [Achromobacter xylosoxidans]|uniref:hypothetical protein n=1 Tax=Alcaligenes xylosoxydans xylosoxydans TaxID=85698 RepID=UPI0010413EDF|nr:hypothetical protein [Achromobacter xylosoxidans]MCZ8437244.1 hypothetical protein [Achromobacter xylosoxidans]